MRDRGVSGGWGVVWGGGRKWCRVSDDGGDGDDNIILRR